MNIKPIGSNQTLLTTNHGDEVLYSYETPVAGYSRALSVHYKTSTHYSVTTTKHIDKYLKGVEHVMTFSPEDIERLFLEGI